MAETTIKVELTSEEAEVVSEALNHVWREIFDRSTTGKGAILQKTLKQIAVGGRRG